MNGNRRRVILYGNTLILQGVWASLAKCAALDVIVFDRRLQSSLEELAACCSAAVIFDLSGIEPQLLLGLFEHPGLLLVGMDAETHQALVWSGQKVAALDAAGLVQVLVETGNGSVTSI